MTDWKDIVRTVAPVLGTALGGPLGGAASKFLADKVLGNPEAGEEELKQWFLGATPEQLLKAKEADQQFAIEMRRLDVQDRTSARELAKADMRPQVLLSVVYSLAYAGTLYAFLGGSVTLQEGTEALFSTVLGVLTAAQVQVMNFWFGSSSGSKDKTVGLSKGGAH